MSNTNTQLAKLSTILDDILCTIDVDDKDKLYILKHALNNIESAYDSMVILNQNQSNDIQYHAAFLRQCTSSILKSLINESNFKTDECEIKEVMMMQ